MHHPSKNDLHARCVPKRRLKSKWYLVLRSKGWSEGIVRNAHLYSVPNEHKWMWSLRNLRARVQKLVHPERIFIMWFKARIFYQSVRILPIGITCGLGRAKTCPGTSFGIDMVFTRAFCLFGGRPSFALGWGWAVKWTLDVNKCIV